MDQRFWADRIRSVEPYVAGEQPKDRQYIKLNTNENPYPPASGAMAALREAATPDLRLYPDPDCTALKAALSKRYGVVPSRIFLGNGSDEVLAFCFAAFTGADRKAVFPDLTYSFYPVYAALFAAPTRVFPVNDDFSIPLDEFCKNDGTVLFANPNAPTSLAVSIDAVEQVVCANPDHVVIVDEAYVDFGAESAVPLVEKYKNLLVVQTFSKSRSFAGLRVGYCFGHENLIAALETVKNSFNSYTIDRAAQAAAVAAVEDDAYFTDTCRKVIATRENTLMQLRALGFEAPESKSNFIFVRHPKVSGNVLFTALRERGILVRWWNKPRLADYLRITIGTPEEMAALVTALKELVEA